MLAHLLRRHEQRHGVLAHRLGARELGEDALCMHVGRDAGVEAHVQVLVLQLLVQRVKLGSVRWLHREVDPAGFDLDHVLGDLHAAGGELLGAARDLHPVHLVNGRVLGSERLLIRRFARVACRHVEHDLLVLREHELLEPLVARLNAGEREAAQRHRAVLLRLPAQQRRERALLDPEVVRLLLAVQLEHRVAMHADHARG